jgi:hypothetical protein
MALDLVEPLEHQVALAGSGLGGVLVQRDSVVEVWRELLRLSASWRSGAELAVNAIAIVLPGERPLWPLPAWVPGSAVAAAAMSTAGRVAAALERLERHGASAGEDGVHWSGRGVTALLRLAERLAPGRHPAPVVAWQVPAARPGPVVGLSHLFASRIEGRLHLTAHFGEQQLAGEWLGDALAVCRIMQCLARRAQCPAGPLTLISARLLLDPEAAVLDISAGSCA